MYARKYYRNRVTTKVRPPGFKYVDRPYSLASLESEILSTIRNRKTKLKTRKYKNKRHRQESVLEFLSFHLTSSFDRVCCLKLVVFGMQYFGRFKMFHL